MAGLFIAFKYYDLKEYMMKNTTQSCILIVSFVLLLFTYGCKDTSNYLDTTLLTSTEFISSDKLTNPTSIIALDSFLVVGDLSSSSLEIYSITDGSFLTTLGNFGKGPGEFEIILTLSKVYNESESIWVFDAALNRLTKYNVTSKQPLQMITLKSGMPYGPVSVEDSLFISPGFSLTEGRFAIFNKDGDYLRSIGTIPGERDENVPIPIHLQAYQGKLRIKPSQDKLVFSTYYADRIDIYNNNGLILNTAFGASNTPPIYSISTVGDIPVMALSVANTRYGYIDVAVTDNYIYGLYSGRHLGDSYANLIHVYDWKGNNIINYHLDYDVRAISVCRNDQRLFAIREYPDLSILLYNLAATPIVGT